ncbi:MAG: OmpH family outer membrane protein [Acidobacteria bacterium]|nr:OmpH family outer membrane protein [Acidobacteriota bacterium]
MKCLVPGILTVLLLTFATAGLAQDKATKVAIINIQVAIAQTNDGQQAAKDIQAKFAPKQQELTKAQQEINALQDQLRNQEKTLSDDARNKLLKSIDDKTRMFNRNNEDATSEFQATEQEAINEIGQKLMGVLGEYAQKNSYSVVLDVSSPQTPVLFAEPSIDITKDIIELYNQTHMKPAASAAPATPAAAAPKPAAPAAAAPAATP